MFSWRVYWATLTKGAETNQLWQRAERRQEKFARHSFIICVVLKSGSAAKVSPQAKQAVKTTLVPIDRMLVDLASSARHEKMPREILVIDGQGPWAGEEAVHRCSPSSKVIDPETMASRP